MGEPKRLLRRTEPEHAAKEKAIHWSNDWAALLTDRGKVQDAYTAQNIHDTFRREPAIFGMDGPQMRSGSFAAAIDQLLKRRQFVSRFVHAEPRGVLN